MVIINKRVTTKVDDILPIHTYCEDMLNEYIKNKETGTKINKMNKNDNAHFKFSNFLDKSDFSFFNNLFIGFDDYHIGYILSGSSTLLSFSVGFFLLNVNKFFTAESIFLIKSI